MKNYDIFKIRNFKKQVRSQENISATNFSANNILQPYHRHIQEGLISQLYELLKIEGGKDQKSVGKIGKGHEQLTENKRDKHKKMLNCIHNKRNAN